jgi:NAD(P)-dependent dehydrogenase (short-subunit alcohol dehydrogenase family)
MVYTDPDPLPLGPQRLTGKVIFVTGASSGIGEAGARRFAAEGAEVVVAARRKERLDALVGELHSEGKHAFAVQCDVSDEGSVQDAITAGVRHFGRLDAAFNNAGEGSANAPLHEIDTEKFDSVVATNLRGTFLCLKYQMPHLIAGGGGSIVVTSSVRGVIAGRGKSDYAASKWALVGLVKSAALDYSSVGVRINAIAPGPTHSELFDRRNDTEERRKKAAEQAPLNYIAHPDDVARAAVFLLSDESRWTTGCVLPCDGGMSIGHG